MARIDATVNVTTIEVSLRDWFAAQAVAGLVSGSERGDIKDKDRGKARLHFVAWASYQIADAMLKERSKPIKEDDHVEAQDANSI